MKRQDKLVSLVEPDLCLDCRFAKEADVKDDQGQRLRVVYCRRLDCDNWNYSTAQNVQVLKVVDD